MSTASAKPSTSQSQSPAVDAVIPEPVKLDPMDAFATDFPQRFAIAFDSLWTANERVDTVTRVDPKSDGVLAVNVGAGVGPQSITADENAIWASGAGGIVRIDPLTNDVTFRSDVGMGSLHFAFDGIWATEGTNLLRIDPATGSTTTTVFTTREPLEPRVLGCGISVAEGSLWLNCGEDLYRVDPTTTDVIATLQDVGPSARVVSAEGGTWVLTGLEPFGVPSNDLAYSRLDRLDTASNEIVAGTAIRLVHGASAAGDTADGRAIWFSTTFGDPPGAGMLYKFDSTSGQVTSAYDISEGMGCGSNAIAFAYGSLWTASGSCNAVRRFPGIVP